jgi:hypothetical protein
VLPRNHEVMEGVYPWFDDMKKQQKRAPERRAGAQKF